MSFKREQYSSSNYRLTEVQYHLNTFSKSRQLKDKVWLSAVLQGNEDAVLEVSCVSQIAITINYTRFHSPQPWTLHPAACSLEEERPSVVLSALCGLHF